MSLKDWKKLCEDEAKDPKKNKDKFDKECRKAMPLLLKMIDIMTSVLDDYANPEFYKKSPISGATNQNSLTNVDVDWSELARTTLQNIE